LLYVRQRRSRAVSHPLENERGQFRLPGEQVARLWQAGRCSPRAFYWGWMPPHPTFFVRHSIYEKHGLFRLDLGTSADYELMLRFLLKCGVRARYIPEVLVKMLVGGVSNYSIRNRILANRNDRKAWTANGLKPYPWTLLMKPFRKLGQWLLVGPRAGTALGP
jgi:glycosyltransferase